jgi:hypothetical protein
MTDMRDTALRFTVLTLMTSFACGNEPAGELFRSDWTTALGATDAAQSDGGKWDNLICPGPYRNRVLSVVAGSNVGWTATPNVLQVTNRGEVNCGLVEVSNAVPSGTNFYIRVYIRVEDENQPSFHSVDLNAVGDIQTPLWAIWDPSPRVDYNPKLTLNNPTSSKLGNWRPRQKLSQGVWYRFEWFVEFVSVSARTARIWPRIYDMADSLLYDASSFVAYDQSDTTLEQYYNGGGSTRFSDLKLARRFGLGYEGTRGASDQGRKWYYAAVELRSDRWPGPVR